MTEIANTIFFDSNYWKLFHYTDLVLDAMDSSGEQHLSMDQNIHKRRLDLNGNPIEEAKKQEIATSTNTVSKIFSTKLILHFMTYSSLFGSGPHKLGYFTNVWCYNLSKIIQIKIIPFLKLKTIIPYLCEPCLIHLCEFL